MTPHSQPAQVHAFDPTNHFDQRPQRPQRPWRRKPKRRSLRQIFWARFIPLYGLVLSFLCSIAIWGGVILIGMHARTPGFLLVSAAVVTLLLAGVSVILSEP